MTWQKRFRGSIAAQVRATGEDLAVRFGQDAGAIDNFLRSQTFDEYVLKFAQPINQTTGENLSTLLKSAMDEGWSIPKTSGHLETMFKQYMQGDQADFEWFADRMPPYRRDMIARTESIRAGGFAANELYKSWGVSQKQWLAERDGRTCPYCLEMDGKIIGVGDDFFKKGDRFTVEGAGTLNLDFQNVIYPPLHPNCRCTLIPVVDTAR